MSDGQAREGEDRRTFVRLEGEDDDLAVLPEPPYWAVVFTSRLSGVDLENYGPRAAEMMARVQGIEGFLGADSVRDAKGRGITVAYFDSEEAIDRWKHDPEHMASKRKGIETWYDSYEIHVSRVEKSWGFRRE